MKYPRLNYESMDLGELLLRFYRMTQRSGAMHRQGHRDSHEDAQAHLAQMRQRFRRMERAETLLQPLLLLLGRAKDYIQECIHVGGGDAHCADRRLLADIQDTINKIRSSD